MNMYLQWYRDQGRGQEAADAIGAIQDMDGSWPTAKLPVTRETQDEKWRHLLHTYGINAMFYEHIPAERPVIA